ncbi:MAG: helix-turn-helix transcriptional regulator [Dorea sp.]|nr:helix-turn-helix transcriptional regulator [Dorea sp.]
MPDFVCRLKRYRQLMDLTQEQLANQVGVRRETIMRLEKAQYNPSLKLAVDISRAVGIPIEEIFIFDLEEFNSRDTSEKNGEKN